MCGNDVIYPTPNTILIDDWIEFQYPFPELNNLRKQMTYLIKTLMIMPSHRYSECDIKAIRALKNILNHEEALINLAYPSNIGEKPRFVVSLKEYDNHRSVPNHQRNGQNWRVLRDNGNNHGKEQTQKNRENWRKPNKPEPNQSNYNEGHTVNNFRRNGRSNSSSNSEVSNGFSRAVVSTDYARGYLDGMKRHTSDGVSQTGSDTSSLDPSNYTLTDFDNGWDRHGVSDVDPATRLLNGLTTGHNRYGNYPDRDIYVLIKPKLIANVRIAYGSSKWVFAPQTEKKILYYHEVSP